MKNKLNNTHIPLRMPMGVGIFSHYIWLLRLSRYDAMFGPPS